ncbi:delta-12 desaturase [Paraphysoderma sedebokerense]|nr:delta-12 desaturase [Paraphysoderma sedebokerense]
MTLSDVASYTLTQRKQAKALESENSPPKKQNAFRSPNVNPASYKPIDVPLKQIRDAIPAHCFERSLFWSFAYLVHDIVLASALFYFASLIDQFQVNVYVKALLWTGYWICQGIVLTGVWVLAHDAGHHGFSDYKYVNYTVGYILHTLLLVPFHSWRITHAKHHKSTGHLSKDQVFVPMTRSEYLATRGLKSEAEAESAPDSIFEDSPLYSLYRIIVMLTAGWPAYILMNVSGQQYSKLYNHFTPSSPFFDERDYWDIVFSDIGIFGMLGALGYACQQYGLWTVAKYYIIPYLFVNGWLVLITFLQHTDPRLPHYRNSAFTFLRGAVATIDRDYGILNHFFHSIGDTHVAHHMFSTMPHYHATEATNVLRKVLGEYYVFDHEGIAKSLWRSYRECQYVDDDGDVVFFRKGRGDYAKI